MRVRLGDEALFQCGTLVPGVLLKVVSVAMGAGKMMNRWVEYMYSIEFPFSIQRCTVQPVFRVDFLKQKLKPAFVSSVF